ncbi:MAG: SDR family oxidoreductase, partial [Geminicoccaceae bacterium]|nr:SDR family oxidoreductase [Geminicoccaceae bacterium]
GMTRSPMTAPVHDDPARLEQVRESIAMGRTAEALEMARPILFLLSDGASFVSGAHLNAAGGGFRIE